MLNLESIPEHIREWAEQDLLPELAKLDTYAKEHAANYEALVNVVVGFVKDVDPSAAPEIATAVAGAEKVLADAEALYEKYFGAKG